MSSSAADSSRFPHHRHRLNETTGLRAAVLGANDGILSTTSLLIGVAAAGAELRDILIAGVAALVSGAMSMAAGEYVSVSSQADLEEAELSMEQEALQLYPEEEQKELEDIYVERGLSKELAGEVAKQLSEHDALEAHARDEIGLTEGAKARPLVAAASSGASFSAGAALPIVTALLLPASLMEWGLGIAALFFLMLLGGIAAYWSGASVWRGARRVGFWGALAMLLSAGVGRVFGVLI
jgi:Uncharacterized membrane protein